MVREDKPQDLLGMIEEQITLVAEVPETVAGKSTGKVRSSLNYFYDTLKNYLESRQEQGCFAIAEIDGVNIYETPSVRPDKVVGVLRATGEEIMGQAVGDGEAIWYKLVSGGWISSEATSLSGACENLPVMEVKSRSISSGTVNIRADPTTNGAIIGSLYPGDPVVVIEARWVEGYFWMYIKLNRDGTLGWVREDFIAKRDNGNTIDYSSVINLVVIEQFNTIMITPLMPGDFTVEHKEGDVYEIRLANGPAITVHVRVLNDGQLVVDLPPDLFVNEQSKTWAELREESAEGEEYRFIQSQYAMTSLMVAWQIYKPGEELTLGDLMTIVSMNEFGTDRGKIPHLLSHLDQVVVRGAFDLQSGICRDAADPANCNLEWTMDYLAAIESVYVNVNLNEDISLMRTVVGRTTAGTTVATENEGLLGPINLETGGMGLHYWVPYSSLGASISNAENQDWWANENRGQGSGVASRWGNYPILHAEAGFNRNLTREEAQAYLERRFGVTIFAIDIWAECDRCTEVSVVTNKGIPIGYCKDVDSTCAQ